MAQSIATPEDFGATGNGTTDDSTALQDWLDEACSGTNADDGFQLGVKPGSKYRFDTPLTLIPNGSYGRCSIDFTGAEFEYRGADGTSGSPITFLTIGDYANDKKWFWVRLIGLYLGAYTTKTYARAVHIEHGNFMQLINCKFGGGKLGALKAGDDGAGLINGLTLQDFHPAGASEGYGVEAWSNAFQWLGGKCQQNRDGLKLKSACFNVSLVDFSLNTGDAIILDGCGQGTLLRPYFEASGPNTDNNTAALIRMEDCNDVSIEARLNCSNGGSNELRNVAYGIHATNCHSITAKVTGNQVQKALIKAIDCDAQAIWVHGATYSNCDSTARHTGPFQDDSGHKRAIVLEGGDATHLSAPSGSGTNRVDSDVSNWRMGSAYNGGTGSDTSEPSDNVVRFPTAFSSAIDYVVPAPLPTGADAVRFRFKSSLVGFIESNPALRTEDFAKVRTLMYVGNGHPNPQPSQEFRITDNAQWQEHYYESTYFSGGSPRFVFQVRADPIDVRFDAIEVQCRVNGVWQ